MMGNDSTLKLTFCGVEVLGPPCVAVLFTAAARPCTSAVICGEMRDKHGVQ